MEINEKQIFDLIKEQDFDKIYNLIKSKKIKNLNIRDMNYNYFIQYIINYNQYKIMELLLNNNININLDILDTDGRSLLYNCIKFNYINIIILLIKYNKKSIGTSILDIKDKLGLTCLHYSVIFNNFEAFKILLESNANPYQINKDGYNVFILSILYNRIFIIEYLLNMKYKINFKTINGETLLQFAITYKNNPIANLLFNNMQINELNNTSNDYGLSALHQTIILDNMDIYLKLLDKNINVNVIDFYGNLPLHYIFLENKIQYLDALFKKTDLHFNVSNINGDIPLHILLDSNIDLNLIDINILQKILLESDLNIQNNIGSTCLMRMISLNLISQFRDILTIKSLNFFIEDNVGNNIKITDEISLILIDSYYNMLKNHKDNLILEWEKLCAINSDQSFKKLKELLNVKDTTQETICKNKIKEIIIKEKRSIPLVKKLNLNFDNGIFTNFCYYTGSPIDVLFGLLLLMNDFSSKNLKVILDYPLTINTPLENHYKKLGINYMYNLDFSNIEIIWSYQKIFYPTYFDSMVEKTIKTAKYIVVPIGIETSVGNHANILFWDISNKTIERFEPNGANYPMTMNYNPELLDTILESKFKEIDNMITYIPPYKFLPTIGFQMLENLETKTCKKIGDPNGFCAVWCTWWVYQRMLNINNQDLALDNIAKEFIMNIKFDNISFKSIIRNFSKKITEIRDTYLKKINIDINDWVVGNFNNNNLDTLEKEIFKNII